MAHFKLNSPRQNSFISEWILISPICVYFTVEFRHIQQSRPQWRKLNLDARADLICALAFAHVGPAIREVPLDAEQRCDSLGGMWRGCFGERLVFFGISNHRGRRQSELSHPIKLSYRSAGKEKHSPAKVNTLEVMLRDPFPIIHLYILKTHLIS